MRLTRTLKTAAAMGATAVLGVSAASAFVDTPPTAVAPQSPLAQPGSDRIDQTAPDPGPGLDWAVRTYVSTSGGDCVEAGRIRDGRFGQVGAGNVFRELALQEGGTCGKLLEEPILLAINHYAAREQHGPRTVLFGRARPDVAEISVTGPEGAQRRLVAGTSGGFLLPLAGALDATDLPVRVTLISGERLTFDWR